MTVRPPAVVLCSDLAGAGVNLDELCGSLRARCPGVAVTVVPHLCRRPAAAAGAIRAGGGRRAVVGACRRLAAAEVRPPGAAGAHDVAVVRVPRTWGTAAATAILAAALERLARLPDGEPGRRSPATAGLRRASLLRLAPALAYDPVAVVDGERCAGVARCGACAAACPVDAIVSQDGRARVATAACEACGRCVGACPAGAIRLAAAAPQQLAAQVAALADGPLLGVVFACTSALAALGDEAALDGWGVVEVPALRIVTPGAVAQTLLAGAARVCVYPCDGDCCRPWRDPDGSLDLARRLLGEGAGGRLFAGPPPAAADLAAVAAAPTGLRPRLAEPEATAAAVAALAAAPAVPHPASPLGLVDIGTGCTACGACAVACPAAALALDEGGSASVVRFDARRCTACGLCAAACPEGVLAVTRGVDPARLAAGTAAIASVPARRCRGCGERLPTAAVLDRSRRLLAASRPELAGAAADLCLACACALPPSIY